MSYRKKFNKIMSMALAVIISTSLFQTSYAAYIPTNRDTKLPPETAIFKEEDLSDFTLLYENNQLAFFFRDDRDILAIKNKATGDVFKTGLDVPFEEEEGALVQEEGLNKTFTAVANSLITIEYYEKDTIKRLSSAGSEGVTSTLKEVREGCVILAIDFEVIDLQVDVEIVFQDKGIQYRIPSENIRGEGKSQLAAILITPFLGASGGKEAYLDVETEKYSDPVDKPLIPGYIVLPDGSGSLVRFEENKTPFVEYIGDVYGKDPSIQTYHEEALDQAVELNQVLMPVFGIAQGNNQKAFVAYADDGAEYMQIIARPKGNMNVPYYWAYPRFEYNSSYYQVYNRKGEGYFSLMKEPHDYDISIQYEFLFGDGTEGTYPADYVGMAFAYRDHLKEMGYLSENLEKTEADMPIRLDFIMADTKKSIIGTNEVVVTTVNDVERILDDFNETGIENINTGLIGWQRNGGILSAPNEAKFSYNIGTKRAFENLIETFNHKGVDISYTRDFSTINDKSLLYYSNAVKHVNGLYPEVNHTEVLPSNVVVDTFSYAKPIKAIEWTKELFSEVGDKGTSYTIDGISNVLASSYTTQGVEYSVTDGIRDYREMASTLGQQTKLNFVEPNMYLWKDTTRFLEAPVGNSQYVFQTDTIPFLQLILNGSMEVYGPYINFSFYAQKDILRMIDYNLYPAFILSEQPSYLLQDTQVANFYSTEVSLYTELVESVYTQMDAIFSQVQHLEWIDREVLEEGIVVNTYTTQEGKEKNVLINYTDDTYTYKGVSVKGLSAEVIM